MQNEAIIKSVQSSLVNELKTDLVTQRSKFLRLQPQSALIPCSSPSKGDSGQLKVLIQQDGEFEINQVAINVRGPVDINGKAIRTLASTLPQLRQTAFPSGLQSASGFDLAAGGLLVQITESSSSLRLTDGFVDVATIASPGYIASCLAPLRLKHTIRRNTTLLFEFRNRDDARLDDTDNSAASDLFHEVSVCLIGKKFLQLDASI